MLGGGLIAPGKSVDIFLLLCKHLLTTSRVDLESSREGLIPVSLVIQESVDFNPLASGNNQAVLSNGITLLVEISVYKSFHSFSDLEIKVIFLEADLVQDYSCK